MSKDKQRKEPHYFHADATGLGGFLMTDDWPEPKNVPVLAPVSIPPSGGKASGHAEDFCFERIATRAAHTHVSGEHNAARHALTKAKADLQHIDAFGAIKADGIFARIVAEHPDPNGTYVPKVSFHDGGDETRFENLVIEGVHLKIKLKLDCLGGDHENGFPRVHHRDDQKLWQKDDAFWKRIADKFNNKTGSLICSLVETVENADRLPPGFWDPKTPDTFHIPEVGKLVLAQLQVHYHYYQLTMMQFELGCKTTGSVSMASTEVGGGGH